jgi:hypothetical protein
VLPQLLHLALQFDKFAPNSFLVAALETPKSLCQLVPAWADSPTAESKIRAFAGLMLSEEEEVAFLVYDTGNAVAGAFRGTG